MKSKGQIHDAKVKRRRKLARKRERECAPMIYAAGVWAYQNNVPPPTVGPRITVSFGRTTLTVPNDATPWQRVNLLGRYDHAIPADPKDHPDEFTPLSPIADVVYDSDLIDGELFEPADEATHAEPDQWPPVHPPVEVPRPRRRMSPLTAALMLMAASFGASGEGDR
jgi:hypothetical protein